LQSGCNLVQGLLYAVQFHLSSVSKLLNALRCALKMMGYVSEDLATALAQQEHAQPANEHSQAAQSVGDLPSLVHTVQDPARLPTPATLLRNMMQIRGPMRQESSWMGYHWSER
jgi:hypothetical protein